MQSRQGREIEREREREREREKLWAHVFYNIRIRIKVVRVPVHLESADEKKRKGKKLRREYIQINGDRQAHEPDARLVVLLYIGSPLTDNL